MMSDSTPIDILSYIMSNSKHIETIIQEIYNIEFLETNELKRSFNKGIEKVI